MTTYSLSARLVRAYHLGLAFFTRCPACAADYIRQPNGPAYPKPCPTCGWVIDNIGCIGIDDAVALIAARRTTT